MGYNKSKNQKYYKGYKRYKKAKKIPNVKQVSWYNPRTWYSGVKYAVKGVNLIKSLVNAELKRFDIQPTVANQGTTPTIQLLSGVDAGTDYFNRDGNSILLKSIYLKANCIMDTTGNTVLVRIIVFVDNDNDGQTPSAAELLVDATSPGNMLSPINVDYSARYTILFDSHVNLSVNGDQSMFIQRFKKLNFHAKYITQTGSTGFGKGNIWVLTVSDDNTNQPAIRLYSRISFYDN